jgi:hypothetical protein
MPALEPCARDAFLARATTYARAQVKVWRFRCSFAQASVARALNALPIELYDTLWQALLNRHLAWDPLALVRVPGLGGRALWVARILLARS